MYSKCYWHLNGVYPVTVILPFQPKSAHNYTVSCYQRLKRSPRFLVSKISCIYCRISNGSSLAYTLTHTHTGLILLEALPAPATPFPSRAFLRRSRSDPWAVCLMPTSVHRCRVHGVTKAVQITPSSSFFFWFPLKKDSWQWARKKVRRRAKWVWLREVWDTMVLHFVSDWGWK